MAAVFTLSATEHRAQTTQQVRESALHLAQLVAASQADHVATTRQLLGTIARVPGIRSGETPVCQTFLAELLLRESHFVNFGVVRPDGSLSCSALPMLEPVNLAGAAYFERALRTRQFAVGQYQLERIAKKQSLSFGYPLLSATGQVESVVFAAVGLEWLDSLAHDHLLTTGSVVTIFDSRGGVLARRPDDGVWADPAMANNAASPPRISGPDGLVRYERTDGTPALLAIARAPGTADLGPFSVMVDMPLAVAYQTANRSLVRNLGVLGMVAVTALTVAIASLRRLILHPVRIMVRAAQRMSEGDLTVRTGPHVPGSELAELSRTFDHMAQSLHERTADLEQAYDTTLAGWSKALDMRDSGTVGHSQRVTHFALTLASRLGGSEVDRIQLRRGALLHDIGKMGIPDAILLKPGPLSDAEWAVMKRHPDYALEMLSGIAYLAPALAIPYCHHEKWDGSGYPRGLKGTQIPLAARIFAVADVWDALCSDRPYRPAWDRERAVTHIVRQAGIHFDPHVVEAFVGLVGNPQVALGS